MPRCGIIDDGCHPDTDERLGDPVARLRACTGARRVSRGSIRSAARVFCPPLFPREGSARARIVLAVATRVARVASLRPSSGAGAEDVHRALCSASGCCACTPCSACPWHAPSWQSSMGGTAVRLRATRVAGCWLNTVRARAGERVHVRRCARVGGGGVVQQGWVAPVISRVPCALRIASTRYGAQPQQRR